LTDEEDNYMGVALSGELCYIMAVYEKVDCRVLILCVEFSSERVDFVLW